MHIQEVTEHFSLDRVVPYFQPIIDLDHDAVWRYECLARLVTPSEQTFLPSDFLYLAERQQSVEKLTENMFHLSAKYFKHLNMAWNINISQQDMLNPGLIDMLAEYLKHYPNPERVCLELTASSAINNLPQFESFLENCKSIGIGVFIDHFGAVPGNINSLLSLPLCGIKIAGSLITQLTENQQTADFVKHLTHTAASKDICVIAEHIEDKGTLEVIKDFSINYAQGFYFCQPKATTA